MRYTFRYILLQPKSTELMSANRSSELIRGAKADHRSVV